MKERRPFSNVVAERLEPTGTEHLIVLPHGDGHADIVLSETRGSVTKNRVISVDEAKAILREWGWAEDTIATVNWIGSEESILGVRMRPAQSWVVWRAHYEQNVTSRNHCSGVLVDPNAS
jgi:hypothetical protein